MGQLELGASIRAAANRLRGRTEPDPRLLGIKLRAIDAAFSRFDLRSAADLGAVWAIDAGYSFHVAERKEVERVVICDARFTERVVELAEERPKVELVVGYLGRQETVRRRRPGRRRADARHSPAPGRTRLGRAAADVRPRTRSA